jgi:hypothetical protein
MSMTRRVGLGLLSLFILAVLITVLASWGMDPEDGPTLSTRRDAPQTESPPRLRGDPRPEALRRSSAER